MAKEEDKTAVVAKGKDESPAAESKPAKPSFLKKILLFGGIGGGIIALGVVLALFVLKPMLSPSAGEPAPKQTPHAKTGQHGSKDAAKDEKPKEKKGGHEASSVPICTIKDIIINPAGTGGSRFLSASFAFDLQSAELAAQFEAREPVIRDALITILSSKSVAQLTDPREKEIVRLQIKKRVAEIMKTDELAGVYYTDFVLQ
ncbi:MAG TPA: flagellar basal body-associated FliL family protein [Candidatus Deferrimicrobium sp.]|nr:flagellar basal body-associated FliL family protein [Candidatus Deferrimicrobium sp.]